ncbi:hypothetical protein FHS79_002182 [Polymorphobacter multimanifer]|uniref:Uncharacterized protein n=1 Tax=Polymorphobacter multimanifer TaxID=1070431 RepID=A0A841L6F6_9SPHN|nr:hypothetical protein [Polymorphobacter multimanifer]MBB6228000.1 hypothetical protein [Polymorphobacter multimanifer]
MQVWQHALVENANDTKALGVGGVENGMDAGIPPTEAIEATCHHRARHGVIQDQTKGCIENAGIEIRLDMIEVENALSVDVIEIGHGFATELKPQHGVSGYQ